ncbi:hypothetical protein EGR_09935 [Echinococcus granulosus]|uniref:Uncharacterized protein n=1 Tax=Echinococcus granulosus TaxID=6210 RepID=W6U3Q6_ECHGR|nr:hypothetical protein EGR_09935 [Echinococcus granulosus]EUB55216.1 hypothetical protein EGR_09935 [Echinococcus granulosus]
MWFHIKMDAFLVSLTKIELPQNIYNGELSSPSKAQIQLSLRFLPYLEYRLSNRYINKYTDVIEANFGNEIIPKITNNMKDDKGLLSAVFNFRQAQQKLSET